MPNIFIIKGGFVQVFYFTGADCLGDLLQRGYCPGAMPGNFLPGGS